VVFQAGASEDGLSLAAETADVVFTAQASLTGAKAFYDEVKARVRRAGRSPDEVKVMTGIMPFVAPTEAEARTLFEEMQALVPTEVGVYALSRHLGGFDLSSYPLDGPLPEDIPEHEGGRSRMALVRAMAKRENLTIRQTYQRVIAGNGHDLVVGSPAQVVDHMEEWFDARATDGFMVLPHSLPTGVTDFVDFVVPELQRRGIFRTEYESTLLRDNLGLPHPTNRFAASPATALRASGF
jgi:alkanesulfonate monooxygenase SsuD/methylene tetrahydromethanopterin reductase-like flavin-dependent oxidoreductase (luciferase family)